MELSADELITEGRSAALKAAPYFASAFFGMTWVPAENHPEVMTMATTPSGRTFYNPEYIMSIGSVNVAAVMIHEAQHHLRRHFERSEKIGATTKRLATIWNIAGDAAINDTLAAIFPEFNVPDIWTRAKLEEETGAPVSSGASEEEMFRILLEHADKKAEEQENGRDPDGLDGVPESAACGSCGDTNGDLDEELAKIDPGLSDIERDMIIRDIAEKIEAAKEQGNIPSDLVDVAAIELTPAKAPWNKVLRAAANKILASPPGHDRPTYSRPHRRTSVITDIIIPSRREDKPSVGLVIDTSGSMGSTDLGLLASEITSMERKAGRLTCYDADTRVTRARPAREIIGELKSGSLSVTGRGGTDMRTAINQVITDRDHAVVVCATDGYTDWPTPQECGTTTVIALITHAGVEAPDHIRAINIAD